MRFKRDSEKNRVTHLSLLSLIGASGLAFILSSGCSTQRLRSAEDFPDAQGFPTSGEEGEGRDPSTPVSPVTRIEQLGQPRKKILILELWNQTPIKQEGVGRVAAQELMKGIQASGKASVPLESVKLSSLPKTEDFIQGDQIKVAQLIKEGKRLGVSVLGIGRISRLIFRQRGDEVGLLRKKQSLSAAEIELKFFDISAGREVSGFTSGGEAESNQFAILSGKSAESPEFRQEMLQKAMSDAVMKALPSALRAVDKVTWEGRVAQVSGKRVFINAGASSGLIPGDILKVMSQGEDIYDENGGTYLGRSKGQLKGTLELVEFLGPEGAATQIHTGANIQEGDVVTLY